MLLKSLTALAMLAPVAAQAAATETVVMAQEPTGWKPIGYFIS